MADSEGPSLGAGGLLGVNNLQRAIDSFDRTVERLSQVSGTWGSVVNDFRAGQRAAGKAWSPVTPQSWNQNSNWSAGKPNGGGPTFGGQPATAGPGGPANGGGGGGPSHRADGPPVLDGGGDQDPTHRGRPNFRPAVSAAVFTAGMADHAWQSLTQTHADANSDSILLGTSAALQSYGQHVDRRKMFSNGWYAQSAADQAAAMLGVSQATGNIAGSAGYNQFVGSVKSGAIANPTLTASQVVQQTAGFYKPSGYSRLRTVGINTIGKNGHRASAISIANQVLAQVDPKGQIRDPESAAAAVNDPMSGLNITLTNWVSNGIIDSDQVDSIKSQITMILKARQKGIDPNRLQKLINERKPGNAADKTLRHAHIGDDPTTSLKDTASAKRQPAIDSLEGFEKRLREASDAIVGFTNAITQNPVGRYFNHIIGQIRGELTQGPLGMLQEVTSLFTQAPGPVKSVVSGIWHALGNPFALPGHGGSNEDRMSMVGSHGGGQGGSNEDRMSITGSQSGSAGFGGGTGEPFRTGKPGMGGAVNSGGNQGSKAQPKHHKKKAHGGTLSWPVVGAASHMGTPFGKKGNMWASGHHTGQDIVVGTGTPVHASAAGTVTIAGYYGSYGNHIIIDHGGGISTLYAHNSRIKVHVGAEVRKGQVIAFSGATGNVTGPHVHFEVRINGTPVDPRRYVNGAALNMGGGGDAGAGAGSSGSGTTDNNGSGQTFGGSVGSAVFGVGASELDIITSALSGAGAMGFGSSGDDSGSSDSGSGSGSGSGSVGGSGSIKTGGGSGAGAVYRALRSAGFSKVIAAGIMGNMQAESGFDPNIIQGGGHSPHPNTRAGYGLVQWTPGTKLKGYIGNRRATIANEIAALRDQLQGRGPSPEGAAGAALKRAHTPEEAARIFGLRYERYAGGVQTGREAAARRYAHAYAKGAWDIPNDEIAQVHKGEMIFPKKDADQIRQILLNGTPYKAKGNQAGSSSGPAITFGENSIVITIQGTGSTGSDGRAIGKAFVDSFTQDQRIKNLQMGAVG